MEKQMTIRQLNSAVHGKNEIYIQSLYDYVGDNLVKLTNIIKSYSGVMNQEVFYLYTLDDGNFVARIDLPIEAIHAFETDNESPDWW